MTTDDALRRRAVRANSMTGTAEGWKSCAVDPTLPWCRVFFLRPPGRGRRTKAHRGKASVQRRAERGGKGDAGPPKNLGAKSRRVTPRFLKGDRGPSFSSATNTLENVTNYARFGTARPAPQIFCRRFRFASGRGQQQQLLVAPFDACPPPWSVWGSTCPSQHIAHAPPSSARLLVAAPLAAGRTNASLARQCDTVSTRRPHVYTHACMHGRSIVSDNASLVLGVVVSRR